MKLFQEDSVKSSQAGKSGIFSNFGYSKICMQKSITGMIQSDIIQVSIEIAMKSTGKDP